MPAFNRSARSHRWVRAVVDGFLAELATVLTIILVVMTYRYVFAPAAPDTDFSAFAARTGEIVGIIGGTLYTFLFASLLMPRLTRHFVAHGLLLAASAVGFSIGGSLFGHHGLPVGYALASSLKLVAGALAGLLAQKRSAALGPA